MEHLLLGSLVVNRWVHYTVGEGRGEQIEELDKENKGYTMYKHNSILIPKQSS